MIQSDNPLTGNINATFDTLTRESLDQKIELAHTVFLEWRNTPKTQKKELFLGLARVIESHRSELAELQTREMGMLYSASFAGLGSTIKLITWYAENFE